MTRDEMMATEPDWQEADQDFEGDEMTEEQDCVQIARATLSGKMQDILDAIRVLDGTGCDLLMTETARMATAIDTAATAMEFRLDNMPHPGYPPFSLEVDPDD